MFQRRKQRATADIRLLAAFAAMLLLQACGSSEEEDPAASNPGPGGPTQYSFQLTGSVGDGPIVNAAISVVSAGGSTIGSGVSTQNAGYDLQLTATDTDFPMTIDAQGGTDLATNAAPGFTLVSALMSPNSGTVANLNPFTTVAVAAARQMSGGLNSSNLSAASSAVMGEFNAGLTSGFSLDPFGTPITDANLAEVIKASEALAEIFRRTQAGLGPAGVSINAVINAIAADMTDGVLDGQGSAGANRRISALAVMSAAQVMLEAMANRLEVGGQDVTPTLDGIVAQLAAGSSPGLTATRPVTTQMIAQAIRGVDAAIAFADSSALQSLRAALAGLSAGMSPGAAGQLLPANSSAVLAATIAVLGSASAGEIDTILTGAAPPPPPPTTTTTANQFRTGHFRDACE